MYHSGNKLIDPSLLFEKVQLREGMHTADLGCGRTGHVVFTASAIVGERGVIYAVDVLKDVLQMIKKRAQDSNLINVQTVWADLERVGYTAIPAHTLDVAFVINVLNQVKDNGSFLQEVLRLLKSKSRLLIVDWAGSNLPFAPAAENLVNFEQTKLWITTHGLVLQEDFAVGNYLRGMVFYKHD